MPMPLAPPVVMHGVTGQKAFHDCRERGNAGFQNQVKMIGFERPRKTLCFCFGNNLAQPLNKKVSVVVVIENFSTVYPPGASMRAFRGMRVSYQGGRSKS
jgi:hypothetical protein